MSNHHQETNLEDNLRFLIRETRKQVFRAQRYLEQPQAELLKALQERDNYIDNLRTFIQRGCFTHATTNSNLEYYKAVDIIAVNLERMADICEDVTDQMQYVKYPALMSRDRLAPFVDEVIRGLDLVDEAVSELNIHVALSICRAEPRLDQLYEAEVKRCLKHLRAGHAVETHVTLLFIWHYFERMGDALLNIGEAVISAALGEKIKIGQLWALEDTMGEADPHRSLEDLALRAVGESKSGCRIVRVSERSEKPSSGTSVIFKEGSRQKVLEEKEGIERWETHLPGMAPKIFSFQDAGDSSAILIEFFAGSTFEQTLLQGTPAALHKAFETLTKNLSHIWTTTRRDEPHPATFLSQLQKRLNDIYALHPEFQEPPQKIGSLAVEPLEILVDHLAPIESKLSTPFLVLNHGDFNLDNIIFTENGGAMRLIDLHRCGYGDYVQDVSVFLVSNHRLQVFEAPVRRRIRSVVTAFYQFARAFAQSVGDNSFEIRLAFGLARSFATSSRFILDERFAKSLFMRARYLLEMLRDTPASALSEFKIPLEVLCD